MRISDWSSDVCSSDLSGILSTNPVDNTVVIAALPEARLREFYTYVKLPKIWAVLVNALILRIEKQVKFKVNGTAAKMSSPQRRLCRSLNPLCTTRPFREPARLALHGPRRQFSRPSRGCAEGSPRPRGRQRTEARRVGKRGVR